MTEILTCSGSNSGACYLFNWIVTQTLYVYAITLPAFVAIKLINRS
ncbi:MAG: hypothetical protein JHC31_14705 [Sulfurihydrogenibium sp.]|jgi:hypothetical protein|nr:hypothetical protein [Sulfurihydrogenibium sp.]MBX0312990.1 hypothetical protein [Sulfurihydrogenibium sp.]